MNKLLLKNNAGRELWIDMEAKSLGEITKELVSNFGNGQELTVVNTMTNRINFIPKDIFYSVHHIKYMIDATSNLHNRDLKKIRYLMNIEEINFDAAVNLLDTYHIVENANMINFLDQLILNGYCENIEENCKHNLNNLLVGDLNVTFYAGDAFFIDDLDIRTVLSSITKGDLCKKLSFL